MHHSNPSERIYFLAEKWRNGSISEEEKSEFNKWYGSFGDVLEVHTEDTREYLQKRLYSSIVQKGNIHQKKAFRWPRLAAAASIAIALGIGGFYLSTREKTHPIAEIMANDIAPGGNNAILTLANGKKIVLTKAKNGSLAQLSDVRVMKTSDGNISYEKTASGQSSHSDISYNIVNTPLGGQYHLTLSDGTNAWLNAGSSIKYPTSFNGRERKVEISGEVYFEVAHNAAKPFRVVSGRQIVEVLGTHFNINAYADEKNIRTTLIEGSVRISGANQTKTISPGEQAVLNSQGITISQADTEESIAWKNGYFRFKDENIGSVMLKLSRWYNIDVSYQGPISGEGFNGKISRYKNISQALKMLEKTGAVHFEVKGRRVTVRQ
ncbi:FecR family protein [Pedobacter miscanthi]|uniref:FecR family protein n=1 Tax=Pedobacter miscanthi TaxID=2259170 RepID=UPI00292FA5C7|nr:FecR domain-containing protein [Pedobacter miscanthi]